MSFHRTHLGWNIIVDTDIDELKTGCRLRAIHRHLPAGRGKALMSLPGG